MIARLVTWVSTIVAIVLIASFGLFAIDQARHGSEQQVAKLAGGLEPKRAATNVNQADPAPRTERARERRHGDVREALDDADDVLISPFAGVVDSSSIWVQRGIPTLIAFLLFGVGLRLLAAYLPGGGRS
ncbi:MAG: hypothetical protein QOH76_2707 [Thermoleophilaceae bacterium]|jgi:hypothetical protein|nr:hypothetical protein [Thermoleophilaceae bacterium]